MPCCPLTPELLGHGVQILMLLQTKHIYECQLYTTISKRLGIGGTTTTSRIPNNLAVVAAAAARPIVESAPAHSCHLQSQGSCRSQGNKMYAHEYLVQCLPNTGSLMSRPLPSLDSSGPYRFHTEGRVDCSHQ